MPNRSLPVLIPVIPGQKWSCHSCGDCCRTLVGHVTVEERDRIIEQGWKEKLGIEPVVRAGRSWVLNKYEDGACVFLDANNRCRIHAEFGEAAKPLACRIFPFSVRRTSRGWQASLRFDCPSATGSEGADLSSHRSWLASLVREMSDQTSSAPRLTYLAGGIIAEPGEIESLVRHTTKWLNHETMNLSDKLVGLAKVLSMLAQAKLKNVRGPRFDDLLDILFETIRGETKHQLPSPTKRQRGMLRQAVLAHAEHVSLAQLRSGFRGRIAQRWRQLRSARRMLSGLGSAPQLPGFSAAASFDQIARVRPAAFDAIRIENLLRRYLTARIEGDSVFGAGYYGWPALDGMAALCLSVAAAGWHARYIAAGRGSETIGFADAAMALGVVDRAATRLPALGTWAEKNRLRYLLMDDGLARVIAEYPLGGTS